MKYIIFYKKVIFSIIWYYSRVSGEIESGMHVCMPTLRTPAGSCSVHENQFFIISPYYLQEKLKFEGITMQ